MSVQGPFSTDPAGRALQFMSAALQKRTRVFGATCKRSFSGRRVPGHLVDNEAPMPRREKTLGRELTLPIRS